MINIWNYYIFNKVDDIIDRVPNTQLEENYGSLTVTDPTDVPPFWQKLLGPDHERTIRVVSACNFANPKETKKVFNLFGLLFQEMQELAQSRTTATIPTVQASFADKLSENSCFTTWLATGLCLPPVASPHMAPPDKPLLFNDMKSVSTMDDLETTLSHYHAQFRMASFRQLDGNTGQVLDDVQDVMKDLHTYLYFYPHHATTNTVLVRHQINNPVHDLLKISPYDLNVNRVDHPLYETTAEICRQNFMPIPPNGAFEGFDPEKDVPAFKSIGQDWQWLELSAPILAITETAHKLKSWQQKRNNGPDNTPKPPQAR